TLPDGDGDGVPDTADNCNGAANPAQDDLDGDGTGDVCDPDIDGDGRANGSDCAPRDATASDFPAESTNLTVVDVDPSLLGWDPDPAQGVGLVFDLLRGDVATLISDGGVA